MKRTILTFASSLAIAGLAFLQTSCTEEKEHDHEHGEHEHHDEGDKGHAHGDHADHGDEHAEGKHGHDHDKMVAGPHGGRILKSVEPHLEFIVTDDRKVQIAAVDDDNNSIPVKVASVSVIGGERSNPTRMSFAKSGVVLVSDIAFPEGNDFPVVVQIKETADAKTVSEKFNLNLVDCPTCDYKEYACICDHAPGDHDHAEKE